MSEEYRTQLEGLGEFARERIANHPALFDPEDFPLDLLDEMGAEKLLGAPDPASVARGVEIIARETGSLGFAVFWEGQSLVPLALERYASLPGEVKTGVATGAVVIALAISEPNVGTHPKRLAATATKVPGGWRLDGEKVFMTNGPIASHLAVLAITAAEGTRKEFSIFLVPTDTPGLTRIDHPQLDYLRPAQHCSFRLEECVVPESALLGRQGKGFEDLAKPFRGLEDAVLASGLVGGLAYCDRAIVRALGEEIPDDKAMLLGELAGIETALDAVNSQLLWALESWDVESEATSILLVAIDDLARRAIDVVRRIEGATFKPVERALRDLEKMLGIARSAKEFKKARIGRSYFAE